MVTARELRNTNNPLLRRLERRLQKSEDKREADFFCEELPTKSLIPSSFLASEFLNTPLEETVIPLKTFKRKTTKLDLYRKRLGW